MGDRAVSREGRITIMGRSDDMLKINGVRVYLSELSRTLLHSFPTIISHAHCVSAERSQLFRGPIVVVFCVRKDSLPYSTDAPSAQPDERELWRAIRRHVHVPPVPLLVEWLAKLPMQPHSGKLDRQALRRLADSTIDRRSGELSPESRLEATADKHFVGQLDAVTRDVLEALYSALETALMIDPQDELQSLGLSSLSAVLLIEALREKGYPLPIETLFFVKTVASLVETVRNCKRMQSSIGREFELTSDRYKVVPFDPGMKEMLIELLSEGFSEQNDILAHIDMTQEHLKMLYRHLPFEKFEASCSFLVFAADTDVVVEKPRPLAFGISMEHNVYVAESANFKRIVANVQLPTNVQILLSLMEPADAVFQRHIDEHRSRFLAGRKNRTQVDVATRLTSSEPRWLYQFFVVVNADVVRRADGEAALLVDLIERETLRRAREAGYTATYTANTNRVTIVRDAT